MARQVIVSESSRLEAGARWAEAGTTRSRWLAAFETVTCGSASPG
jgi:hypothetical protein